MFVLQIILAVLLSLVALVYIIALFSRKEYVVERTVIIKRPKQEVFDYVKLLKNQEFYTVWSKMDVNMQREYLGTDGTVGAIMKWNSKVKNVGVGEQEIHALNEDKSIDWELRFLKPFRSTSRVYMLVESVSENETKVCWGFDGRMGYPQNVMLLMMNMEQMLGKDLQGGLDNLKKVLES
ncbi:MAG: SRPBCC family protein [Bacteroidota bacterium]|nr:SRPBCC family protein [Bacteroidota bacterium]